LSEITSLGVHCSISGGLENSIEEALRLGTDTLQVFTKNQRQWKERVIAEGEGVLFRNALHRAGIRNILSHTSYLINLGSPDENIRNSSMVALEGELVRCHALNIPYSVLHPGSGKHLPEEETIQRIAEGLLKVLNLTMEYPTSILLENTAGQGSSIGRAYEQLAKILQMVGSPRLGICFDTCHAFAAGYDIRTKKGIEQSLTKIDQLIGIEKLKAFHLNDSKGALGSRIDRHTHIGQGNIGLEPFKYLMRYFAEIPKIIETEKENNMDIQNLKVLRSFC
jgi:deoxyribonuclease-4